MNELRWESEIFGNFLYVYDMLNWIDVIECFDWMEIGICGTYWL